MREVAELFLREVIEWILREVIKDQLTRHAHKIATAAMELVHNPQEFIPTYHGWLILRADLDIFAQLMVAPMQMSPMLGDGLIYKGLGTI